MRGGAGHGDWTSLMKEAKNKRDTATRINHYFSFCNPGIVAPDCVDNQICARKRSWLVILLTRRPIKHFLKYDSRVWTQRPFPVGVFIVWLCCHDEGETKPSSQHFFIVQHGRMHIRVHKVSLDYVTTNTRVGNSRLPKVQVWTQVWLSSRLTPAGVMGSALLDSNNLMTSSLAKLAA